MRGRILLGSALGVVGLAAGAACGQAAAVVVPDVLLERLHQGAVIERFIAEAVERVREGDPDGDGLDRADVALAQDKARAQARAYAVSEVLRQDLDGDFRVTAPEMERLARGDRGPVKQQIKAILARYDGDGDGVITFAEAATAARDTDEGRSLFELLALDPSGDGRLTAAEMRRIAERAFNNVDRDADGTISPAEHAVIAERIEEARAIRAAPVCAFLPLPAGTRLVAYGLYESDSISSAAIGGPDEDTHVVDVVIEPGIGPLYLVLTSYESMIWRFSGATGRVQHAVVSSYADALVAPARPGARQGARGRAAQARAVPVPAAASPSAGVVSASGVVGLPAGKVTIAPPGCPRYFHQPQKAEARLALASVRRALGRAPDVVGGSYSAQQVILPSAASMQAPEGGAPVPRGFDPGTWPEAARFFPGGLVRIDPRQVVARARVEPYKVLPSQMGISQLIGAGAIQPLGGDRFRVVRPIAHMPPSMGGAHSVTLIFAKGVPIPPGDPGHSCIRSEEDGGQNGGARCGPEN